MWSLFKNQFRAWALLSLSLPVFAQATTVSSTMTLEKLWQQAIETYPSLAIATAQQQAAAYGKQSADAQLRPKVRFQSELSYAWMEKKNFPRTANQLRASYPLYQPELADKQDQQAYLLEASYAKLEEARQQIRLKVAKAYLDYQIGQAKGAFLAKEHQAILETLNQVQQRFQVGYQDLNDIVEVQAKLDRNSAESLAVDQTQVQTLAALEAYVGQPLDRDSLSAKDLSLWVAAVSSNIKRPAEGEIAHPKLQVLDWQWQSLQKQQSVIQNQDGIKLEAFGALVYNESDGNFYDDMQGARGGVELSVPLYLGGKTDSDKAQAKAQAQALLAQKRQVNLDLEVALKQSQLGIEHGLQRLKVLKAVLASSQQALKSTEDGLKTGARNILDLLNAQSALYKAEQAIPVTQAAIAKDWVKFAWAKGRLSADLFQN